MSHTLNLIDSPEPIIDNMTPAQLESYFIWILSESNRLAKTTDHIPKNIAMAKMINYCVRMLHGHGWVPRTVIRAMVHAEAGSEGSLKGLLHRSMRERRDESRRARREDNMRMGDEDVAVAVSEKSAKSKKIEAAGVGEKAMEKNQVAGVGEKATDKNQIGAAVLDKREKAADEDQVAVAVAVLDKSDKVDKSGNGAATKDGSSGSDNFDIVDDENSKVGKAK